MKDNVLKSPFFENTILKIIALAFAIALWFLVIGEKKVEVSFRIPLELKNLPKDMMIIGESVREIEVTILGSKKLLQKLSPAQLMASVDLSNTHVGINNLRITHSDIKAPKAVEIINVNPSSILVHLEPAVKEQETGK